MTEPNAELAWRGLDATREHPESFDMGSWAYDPSEDVIGLAELTRGGCNTTACYAGWAVALSGYRLTTNAGVLDASGGLIGSAPVIACELLGIDEREADRLFFCAPEDLPRIVADVFGPRPGRVHHYEI